MAFLFQSDDWTKLFQYLGPYSLVIVVLLLLHRMGLIGKPDFSAIQSELKEMRESVQKVTDSLLTTIRDINQGRTNDVTRVADALSKLSEALNQWTEAKKK